MFTGIDHLVIAVDDPDTAATELAAALGLTAGDGGRHQALGTFNRLIWLGDTYLELIGVFDAALARASWVGAPTVRALEIGGGLATWAIATDAIDADVARLRAHGSDLAQPVAGERARPDGGVVRWRLAAAPLLAPDAPPFLIEHDRAGAEWTPAERAERAASGAKLTVLEVGVATLPEVIGRHLRTLDLRFRPSLSGGGARDTDIGGQVARLRWHRGGDTPRTTIRLTIPDRAPATIDLLDCRWVVGP